MYKVTSVIDTSPYHRTLLTMKQTVLHLPIGQNCTKETYAEFCNIGKLEWFDQRYPTLLICTMRKSLYITSVYTICVYSLFTIIYILLALYLTVLKSTGTRARAHAMDVSLRSRVDRRRRGQLLRDEVHGFVVYQLCKRECSRLLSTYLGIVKVSRNHERERERKIEDALPFHFSTGRSMSSKLWSYGREIGSSVGSAYCARYGCASACSAVILFSASSSSISSSRSMAERER